MSNQDDNPGNLGAKKSKVRRAHEHASGIIVPRWWRGNAAIAVGVVAVASVVYAGLTLDRISDRVEQQASIEKPQPEHDTASEPPPQPKAWYKTQEPLPSLPRDAVAEVFSHLDEGAASPTSTPETPPIRAYEEPLPSDLYEESPVLPDAFNIPDASGPRVSVPEEYIPETNIRQAGPSPKLLGNDEVTTPGHPATPVTQATAEPDGLGHDDLESIVRREAKIGQENSDDTQEFSIKPFEQALLKPVPLWMANAIPFPVDGTTLARGTPMIAIVIDDMGVDRRRSDMAAELPGPLTLSFLTYAHDLDHQTQAALDRGHELMVHIPMEPGSSTVDPGPNVLRVDDDIDQTLTRLRWGLERFDGYVGLNNHMGSKFTQNTAGVRAVLEEVKNRGLLFLDSRTAAGSVAADLASKIGVPFATRNVFLDHVDNEEEVRKRLAQTERLARKNGSVVAIGHPHDATLNVLREWLPTVATKGLMLVPMSTLVRRTWLQDE